jgi:hypothetical protein
MLRAPKEDAVQKKSNLEDKSRTLGLLVTTNLFMLAMATCSSSNAINIPKLEVLAALQCELRLGLAHVALQSQHNLLRRLGLLVEDGLGLTTCSPL